MKLGRALFYLILGGAIVTGLFWLLYVPYTPDRVLDAIPSESLFVSVQRNVAEHAVPLLTNRIVSSTALAAGINADKMAALRTNKVTQAWIRQLGSDLTAVAYIPSLGAQGKPAWALAAWIGKESQITRWKLFWFRPKSIHVVASEYGRTIYETAMRQQDARTRLSFSFVEGMVVACISEDPTAARYLVQTFDRQYGRRSVVANGVVAQVKSGLEGAPWHWGWLRLDAAALHTPGPQGLYMFQTRVDDNGHIGIRVRSRGELPLTAGLDRQPGLKAMRGLLGESPDGAVVAPSGWIRELAAIPSGLPLWAEPILSLARTDNTNALTFVTLLNRKHCGRIRGPLGHTLAALVKGLRVPVLLIGVQTQDETAAAALTASALDRFNSRYGTSLTAQAVRGPGGTINLIKEGGRNTYSKFEPDECVAWTCRGGWLILASHAGVLRNLLAESPTEATDATPLPYEVWRQTGRTASAFAWFNMESASRLFKDALSAASIALMLRNADETAAMRDRLESARQWADFLSGLGDVSLIAGHTNGWIQLDVELSPAASGPSEGPH